MREGSSGHLSDLGNEISSENGSFGHSDESCAEQRSAVGDYQVHGPVHGDGRQRTCPALFGSYRGALEVLILPILRSLDRLCQLSHLAVELGTGDLIQVFSRPSKMVSPIVNVCKRVPKRIVFHQLEVL